LEPKYNIGATINWQMFPVSFSRAPGTFSPLFDVPVYLVNFGLETDRYNTTLVAGKQVPDLHPSGGFGESREFFLVNWATNWGGWR
jgi:hypothetical protein